MRRIQSRELPQQSLRGNNVVQPLELATGFEPRIVRYRKMFRRFTDSPATCDHRAVLLEHAHRAVTLVPTMRNPVNVLAKGLIAKKDRGDKTAIELFIAGIQGWQAGLRRRMGDGTPVLE
jgi:hypothetical protein